MTTKLKLVYFGIMAFCILGVTCIYDYKISKLEARSDENKRAIEALWESVKTIQYDNASQWKTSSNHAENIKSIYDYIVKKELGK